MDQHVALKRPAKSNQINVVRKNAKKYLFLYLLAAPALLYFLVFKYGPMWGLLISFQDYSAYQGFFRSEWVGFEHFERFFANPDFVRLLRNTMAINVLNLVFFFPLPIIISLMLNEVRLSAFKRTVQSIIYLPHFLSWVIIAGITFLILSQSSGILNKMIVAIGFQEVGWMTRPDFFWILLTLQSIWKDAGWGTILFLAGMANVDPQLYEASKIDGANRFRQAWHVTLPGIRTIIFTLLILRLGHIMDVGFEQVFLMMNGAVSDVADVFDTYVYRVGIQQAQFSYSTAIGMFKSVVGFILVIGANALVKKFGEDGVY